MTANTRFDVIPAIDLLDGKAVRLFQGDYSQVTVYSENPVDFATTFRQAGARIVHIVDLNAARGEPGVNVGVIRDLVAEAGVAVELGGGIRSRDDVARWADSGVSRLIVGTQLVRDPEAVGSWQQEFDSVELWAGIDARDGEVKVNGWKEGSAVGDLALAAQAASLGLKGIVYTNIALDGTLAGPDLERSVTMARASGLPLVISGGVGSLLDLQNAARLQEPGISGAILGKAYYSDAVDLASALALNR